MRRLSAVVLVVAASLAAFASDAAPAEKRRPRVVFAPYDTVGVNLLSVDLGEPGVSHASIELEPLPGERTLFVELRDDSGYPVRGEVSQDRKGIGAFCGHTPQPLAIDSRKIVVLTVYSGTCGDSLGIATRGGATATFR